MAFTKKKLELIRQCFISLHLVGLHPGDCPSQMGLSTSNCAAPRDRACDDCLQISLQKEMHLSKKSYRLDVDLALDCFKALSFMGINFSMCPEEASYHLKNGSVACRSSHNINACTWCWITATQEALEGLQ